MKDWVTKLPVQQNLIKHSYDWFITKKVSTYFKVLK